MFDELLCSPVSSTAKVLHEKNDAVLDLMDAPTSIGDRVRLRTDCSDKSNCRSRGHEFDPCLVLTFRGDCSCNNFYDHSPPSSDSRRVVVS